MEENKFGDFLYEYRAKNKLSVQNLHEITGVSQPYLSQMENGSKTPSRKIVNRIAKGISNNDKTDIKEIHNKLLRLAGYSEIRYADSFFELFNNDKPSLNLFNLTKNGLSTQTQFSFPVNDLYFHLTDEDNQKMYKTIILNDNDRIYINSMIEIYLLRKYEIKGHDRDNEINYTEKDFSDIKNIIKNKKVSDYFNNKEGD